MNSKLNRQGIGLVVGLSVQFLLGIAVNLYVQFPEDQGPKAQWDFAGNNWLVIVHLLLGTLLVLGAIALVVRAVRAKSVTWKMPAIAGLLSLILAWVAGDGFVATQADGLSYMMAVGFTLGILSYVWGLYRSGNQIQKP